ncbi:hypothetical protein [uncultured Prevotella sp.]|nr:hypothetical protein [uncultured Prevotella sp.]
MRRIGCSRELAGHFSDFSTNRPYKVRDAIDKKGRKVLWTGVSMSEL